MKEKNVKFNIVDLNTGTIVTSIVQPLKDYYNKQQQRSYNTRTTNMIKNMNVVITDNGVPINQEQFNQPRVTPIPEPEVNQPVVEPEPTKVENQEPVSEEQQPIIPELKLTETKEFKERLKNLKREEIEVPKSESEIKNDEDKIEEKVTTIIEEEKQLENIEEKPNKILTEDEVSNFFNVINKENEDKYRKQQNRKFNKYSNTRKNKKGGKQNRKSSYTSYSEIKENNNGDYSDLPEDVQETIKGAINQYDYSEYENQPTHEKMCKNKKGGEY